MELRCSDVFFDYGDHRVLEGLTVSLSRPGLTLVLGKNGCGKSTLLRLLAGLLSPSSGEIVLDGRNVGAFRPRERALRIAWLSQSASFVPRWPLFDYVLSARYAYRRPLEPFNEQDHALTAEMLSKLDIHGLADRSLDTLSGGEHQLARIARTLVQETPVVLLDEPFGSLDIRHRSVVWRELIRRDRSAVAVTHDLSMIGEECENVVLIKGGRCIAQGTPEETLTPENIRQVFDWSPPAAWTFQSFHWGS